MTWEVIDTMTKKTQDKFLAQMLEGYEKGLEGIDNFITEHEAQLEGAKARREEMLEEMAELKELLGLTEETE